MAVRLTAGEHRALLVKAKAAGAALSTFLRMAALERVGQNNQGGH